MLGPSHSGPKQEDCCQPDRPCSSVGGEWGQPAATGCNLSAGLDYHRQGCG